MEFSKVKLGGTELAGAQIEIYKGTQKVSEWTSTTTSHKIQLEPGTYRFHEEAAPAGFLAVTDFTFTVNADGTVTLGAIAQSETVVAANGKITVTDNAQTTPTPQPTTKEIEFSKVKLGGTELAGAQIEIYKGTQKVSEWTSTTTSHKIQLEPGTYRFHEEAAPAGFLAVTDFTFTVNSDGTVTLGAIAQGETVVAASGKITVTDNAQTTPTPTPTTKEIEFSKVKLGGTELAGAQIEIYKGTQKVSEWTSTTTSKKIQLEPGTYRFHEEAAPAGFLAVTDFTFTVNADGTVTLGAIAQGETIVAASGKINVTDNAKPEPTTPGTTPKPGAKKPSVVVKSKSPKTGDEGNFAQYALLLLSSGLALSAIGYNRRKNVK